MPLFYPTFISNVFIRNRYYTLSESVKQPFLPILSVLISRLVFHYTSFLPYSVCAKHLTAPSCIFFTILCMRKTPYRSFVHLFYHTLYALNVLLLLRASFLPYSVCAKRLAALSRIVFPIPCPKLKRPLCCNTERPVNHCRQRRMIRRKPYFPYFSISLLNPGIEFLIISLDTQ